MKKNKKKYNNECFARRKDNRCDIPHNMRASNTGIKKKWEKKKNEMKNYTTWRSNIFVRFFSQGVISHEKINFQWSITNQTKQGWISGDRCNWATLTPYNTPFETKSSTNDSQAT